MDSTANPGTDLSQQQNYNYISILVIVKKEMQKFGEEMSVVIRAINSKIVTLNKERDSHKSKVSM